MNHQPNWDHRFRHCMGAFELDLDVPVRRPATRDRPPAHGSAPSALSVYACMAGFETTASALGFLADELRLSPADQVCSWNEEAGDWDLVEGFRVVRATTQYIAVETFGELDDSLGPRPPATRLLPPFFSPQSVAVGWQSAEHDHGHLYHLLDPNGRRAGCGLLIEVNGKPRWFVGRSLKAAAVARRQADPQP